MRCVVQAEPMSTECSRNSSVKYSHRVASRRPGSTYIDRSPPAIVVANFAKEVAANQDALAETVSPLLPLLGKSPSPYKNGVSDGGSVNLLSPETQWQIAALNNTQPTPITLMALLKEKEQQRLLDSRLAKHDRSDNEASEESNMIEEVDMDGFTINSDDDEDQFNNLLSNAASHFVMAEKEKDIKAMKWDRRMQETLATQRAPAAFVADASSESMGTCFVRTMTSCPSCTI
jgi:hypothetical protein